MPALPQRLALTDELALPRESTVDASSCPVVLTTGAGGAVRVARGAVRIVDGSPRALRLAIAGAKRGRCGARTLEVRPTGALRVTVTAGAAVPPDGERAGRSRSSATARWCAYRAAL